MDRIIAMEYLNRSAGDQALREEDQNYMKALTPAEKTYIKLLAKDLSQEAPLPLAEQTQLLEATSFYSSLSLKLKARWNRLVSQSVLPTSGSNYKLSPSDAEFRRALTPEQKENLAHIQNFRFTNERILSENIAVEANDHADSNVNFGVAKFTNSQYNYISVRGTLVKNENGAPLSNYPVSVMDASGKIIAKSSTGVSGDFVFQDIPRGDYSVVADGITKSTRLDTPFFVKNLSVTGSSEGNYAYTVNTNIYFDFDSDELRSEAKEVLKEIAQLYKKSGVYIQLKSHTDDIGADHYNIYLSQKRNERVLNELKKSGINADDMEWLAIGDQQPVADNSTAYGRQFNRRIEISLKSNSPISYQPLQVYVVRPKGTLYSIAKNFNTDVATLVALNGLEGGQLNAYSPIRIPNPNGVRPNLDMLVELNESVADAKNVYVTKQGDTVMTIAEKFNIPEELLIEMNNLKGVQLKPGRSLHIYVRDF